MTDGRWHASEDAGGRIVSQGHEVVRRGVDVTPERFEVRRRTIGREASFTRRIWEQVRPGMQGLGR